jgi:hypothetical protein
VKSSEEQWLLDLRAAARADSRAYDLIRSLTDEVGPRFSGTPGEAAAVQWALEAMRRAGLTNVRTEPAPTVLWARGPSGSERVEILAPRRERLVATALGGSVPTAGGAVEAQVVEATSMEEIDRLGRAQLEGRILYLHHVMPRLMDGTGYNAGGWARTAGASRAAKYGAVGFVIRSIATHSMRVAHTGVLHYDGDQPKIPAAALSPPDGDLLHRLLSSGARVRLAIELGCRPLHAGESFNVLGEIPGTDLADQIVLFGAHLDSWDVGRGAVDDGAGCAMALEVARMIGALPKRPRRTLRIALFANEELGAGGGRAYAAAHADEASRHFVAMEADQGDGAPWALRVPEHRRDGPAAKRLAALLAPLQLKLDPGPARGGVDVGPLHAHGVPFVDLRQDATRYFDLQHSANDVLENVVREDLDAATGAFATTVALLLHMNESLR